MRALSHLPRVSFATVPRAGFFSIPVALVVVAAAVVPFPGRWALLQQIIPIALVGVLYWRRRVSRTEAGLGRPEGGWLRCILLALILAPAIYAIKALTVMPIAHWLAPEPKDLSAFAALEGSLPTLALYLAFMWPLAAFGEEFFWRGFLLRGVGWTSALGRHSWWLGVVVTAALFAAAHAYQGPRGVLEKFAGGLMIGGLYLWSGRSSIWLVVLVHGIQNTISFVTLYGGFYDLINPFAR